MYSNQQTGAAAEILAPPPELDARKTEYRLFEQVTRDLEASKAKVKSDSEILRALDDNRRLWHALEEDLARPHNQLPDPLKAQIISVAIWVERHSKLAEQGEVTIDALIQVNESIMKGLAA